MNSAEVLRGPPRNRWGPPAILASAIANPRVWVYLVSTVLAVSVSYLLGKDMNWDTLDYHFYAGFSALHDRFGMDYFPAGSQSYFNPYIYVPFYLLARSRLPALLDASILAVLQSGILWLTYEIGLTVAPTADRRTRAIIAVGAALLAFANPILIDQFGSSYADVTTAEIVLAGWLLLAQAVRSPSLRYVIWAALLLGVASALKLTNCVHALCASVLLLFIPLRWATRWRWIAAFGATVAISFVLVCLPWSLRLEQHFGNPFFPLFNEVFRSPQFPAARVIDYRFIPDSFMGALWRPFAIVKPIFMVDDERQSPDLRYAVLLVAAIALLLRWAYRRIRAGGSGEVAERRMESCAAARPLGALGTGFLVDWILWLTASGNGRYFIAMACVAGVLVVAFIWQLIANPRIRHYVLAILFGVQFLQLSIGTVYRDHIPWDGGQWFDVKLPPTFPRMPALYLSYGVQANAFIVPFLPPGSGFINVAGDYPLGSGGANGAAVAALIRKYSPHLRVLARDERAKDMHLPVISGISAAADALLPFGLMPVRKDCSTILIPNEGPQQLIFVRTEVPGKSRPATPDREVPVSTTGYLTTCPAVPEPAAHVEATPGEQRASLALDHLEDACPSLFQPARPLTQYFGDDIWVRRYLSTNLTAWVSRGWVEFLDPIRGGAATYIGPEAAFERRGVRVVCGRRDERYFAKLAPDAAAGDGS